MINALIEAAYLTNVERNADVVVMSSYAPLLAKEGHTNWNPDLIYFNNKEVKPTANYYVQRAFGQNSGDEYIYADLQVNGGNEVRERLDYSVVKDSQTGDLIIKVVSLLPKVAKTKIDLGEEALKGYNLLATQTLMSIDSAPDRQRDWGQNISLPLNVDSQFTLDVPPYSLSIIRIKTNSVH